MFRGQKRQSVPGCARLLWVKNLPFRQRAGRSGLGRSGPSPEESYVSYQPNERAIIAQQINAFGGLVSGDSAATAPGIRIRIGRLCSGRDLGSLYHARQVIGRVVVCVF